MPQISQETKEQVLAATDIVDLIGGYINVIRAGGAFKALCPFHSEKSPSFNINPVRQFFHCFGCGKSGDAITFVREYENLTYTDAIKRLASRVGITVQEEVVDPKEDYARRQRGRQLDLHREVAEFMHQQLFTAAAKPAREYMKSRGFGKEMAERWKVGWMPNDPEVFKVWARTRSFKRGEWIAAGFFKEQARGGVWVNFQDRLMFPICNEIGDVIAFSGRVLPGAPPRPDGTPPAKYKNSPETAVFKKSHVLFGLDRARKAILRENAAVIVEGQLDAICCHEQGFDNVVGGQGTAFTAFHAKLLRRYAKNVILCYDADGAGLEATEKAFRLLAPEGLPVKVARMPAGEDPDSCLQKLGADGFREILAKAVEFFDFKIERAAAENKLTDLQQRSAFAKQCTEMLALVPDPMMREEMINHLATRLKGAVGVPELRDSVAKAIHFAKKKPAGREDRMANAEPAPVKAEPMALDPGVGYLCALALHCGPAQEWLGEQYEALHEAAEYIEGVPLLELIISARPDPEKPAAVNAFISGLSEEQRQALYADPTFHHDPPENWMKAAEEAVAGVSAKALLRKDARITAELRRTDLKPEEMFRLVAESARIGQLLSGLKERFMFSDRFAPVKKVEKKPFFRRSDSGSRPQNNP